ncbi:MAG: hypothetical protein DDG58_14195 [Ardenticatenia bacterium]|nr:MAG: hypothetical protein DDG58_14195 [Ardenticatenia bacterium]
MSSFRVHFILGGWADGRGQTKLGISKWCVFTFKRAKNLWNAKHTEECELRETLLFRVFCSPARFSRSKRFSPLQHAEIAAHHKKKNCVLCGEAAP